MTDLWQTGQCAVSLLLAADPQLRGPLAVSLVATAYSLALATPAAVMLALWLTRSRFNSCSRVLRASRALLPLPLVAAGVTLVLMWAPGRAPTAGPTLVPVLVLLALPLLVGTSHAALRSVDPAAWETARTLGARLPRAAWAVVHEVRRPLAARLLGAGVRTLAEVGAAFVLAGDLAHVGLRASAAGAAPAAAGVAAGAALLLLALGLAVAGRLLQRRGTVPG